MRLPASLNRRLRWIIGTPDTHRVHHSTPGDEANSRFGFNLSWWGRLFGTYDYQPTNSVEPSSIFRKLKRLFRAEFAFAAPEASMNSFGSPIVAVLVALAYLTAPAHAASCASGLVEVEADDAGTVGLVCKAVDEVLTFLGNCGMQLQRPFAVEIIEELPQDKTPHYLGYYDHEAKRVVVLDFDLCSASDRSGGSFQLPMSLGLYRSLLIHEITHAVIAQHWSGLGRRRVGHEYAAYAIQLATMGERLRSRILARFPHDVPVDDVELSELYLDLSPSDFAVKAYLHFGMPVNGCGYLRRLLRGEQTLPTGME